MTHGVSFRTVFYILMSPPQDSSQNFNVSNLTRGLDILELLLSEPAGLGISDIAARLELPKNAVFRITGALLDRGYLEALEPGKRLRLSARLLRMGYQAADQESLIEKAMPILRTLRDQVGETTFLCIRVGLEGMVLEQVHCRQPFRWNADPGMRFSLHASAPGKAMLAFASDEEGEEMIGQLSFERFTPTTITDPALFRRELRRVRKVGYAQDDGEGIEGIRCVAAPVFCARKQAVAAIVITGPTNRVRTAHFPVLGAQVCASAEVLSDRMGLAI